MRTWNNSEEELSYMRLLNTMETLDLINQVDKNELIDEMCYRVDSTLFMMYGSMYLTPRSQK